MSAMQRSLCAVALLLGLVGIATPAAAQRGPGIWVHTHLYEPWTLTVINLTNHPLVLVKNSVTVASGDKQRPPFDGDAACDANTTPLCFPIAPYRTVTWKSVGQERGSWGAALPPFQTLTFLPRGMDQKWTVSLHFMEFPPVSSTLKGTYIYLDQDFFDNHDWYDGIPQSCSDWRQFHTYNVMMLSGTDLAVTLFAPYIVDHRAPTVDVTLVFRQRWPGHQDSLFNPCVDYLDNTEYP